MAARMSRRTPVLIGEWPTALCNTYILCNVNGAELSQPAPCQRGRGDLLRAAVRAFRWCILHCLAPRRAASASRTPASTSSGVHLVWLPGAAALAAAPRLASSLWSRAAAAARALPDSVTLTTDPESSSAAILPLRTRQS